MLTFSKGYIALTLVPAALAVLLGIGGFVHQERFNRRAISTNGTFEAFDGPAVLVKYSDKAGRVHTLKTSAWKSINRTKPIPVLYDSEDPSNARLKASDQAGPFLLIIAGILSLSHLPYWEIRLRRWAGRNGCSLETVRPVFMWNNPFGTGSAVSGCLITFDVDVVSDTGNRCRAWIEFGSFWWPSLKEQTMWEDDEEGLMDKLEERRAGRPRVLTPLERAAQKDS